jgi:hypothetical protein
MKTQLATSNMRGKAMNPFRPYRISQSCQYKHDFVCVMQAACVRHTLFRREAGHRKHITNKT